MRQLVPGIKVFGGSLDNVKGCTDKVDNGSISPESVDTKMSRRWRKKNAERENTETSSPNPSQSVENHRHFSALSNQIFRLLTNLAVNYRNFADYAEYCGIEKSFALLLRRNHCSSSRPFLSRLCLTLTCCTTDSSSAEFGNGYRKKDKSKKATESR
ncbi:hypothetical protein Ancab_002435 [Ancistrocladus abbreviatus]